MELAQTAKQIQTGINIIYAYRVNDANIYTLKLKYLIMCCIECSG